MTVSIETVLQKYESLLTKRLTYNEADRWAWKMMELQDAGKLIFEPPANERIIWELITFLYGIDVPSTTDRTQPSRGDTDVIDFLKEKGLYRLYANIKQIIEQVRCEQSVFFF